LKKVRGRSLTLRQQENIVCRHWSMTKRSRRKEFDAWSKKATTYLNQLAAESSNDGLQHRAKADDIYEAVGIPENDFVGYANTVLLTLVRAEQAPNRHLAFDPSIRGTWWFSPRPQDLASWFVTRVPPIITELEKFSDVLTLKSLYGDLDSMEQSILDGLSHEDWAKFLRLIEVVRSNKGPQFSASDMADTEFHLLSDDDKPQNDSLPEGKSLDGKWVLVDPERKGGTNE